MCDDENSAEYLEKEPLNPIPAMTTDRGRQIRSNEFGRLIKMFVFVSSVFNIILIYAYLNPTSAKSVSDLTSIGSTPPPCFTSVNNSALGASSTSVNDSKSTSVSEFTSIGSTPPPSVTTANNAVDPSSPSVNDSKLAPSSPYFALCLVGAHKRPWDLMKDSIYNNIFKSIANVHVFAASDSPTKDIVSMQDLFKQSLIDAMPMTFSQRIWRGEIGVPKSGWPDYAGVCPDGYHSSAYSAEQYMHWEQCLRMIKRQERLQGWQYDLVIKWRVDRQPSEAFPNAADPRWREISDTDYYSQGINQPSTPLNIPFDQWFVIRRKAAHVIMSEFVDTMFECQSIEELKSLISERNWNAYLWNESKLAYHIHKSGMRQKWGVFPVRML